MVNMSREKEIRYILHGLEKEKEDMSRLLLSYAVLDTLTKQQRMLRNAAQNKIKEVNKYQVYYQDLYEDECKITGLAD